MSRLATATIHLGALRHNLARIREEAGRARVMAVVKADAYGHGLERVARALDAADAFGVAAIADGRRLRAAGHHQRIVVLSGPDSPADLDELRRLDLDAVIHHVSQIEWLEADRGTPLRVWLKLDSGMHRLGFPGRDAKVLHARLSALSSVAKDIVLMTHFAASDEFDNVLTQRQISAFTTATRNLGGARSLCNSAGALHWPDAYADWLRIGGLLYGLSAVAGRCAADFGYAPAMTLTTRLIAINHLDKGDRVGYSATWTAPEAMRVGIAAIGYGDGYPRSAAAGTPVWVAGQVAELVGRVSMDMITIDLRHVPQARVGDPVLLWGPDLPAETIAQHADSIAYELTCGMTRRVLFMEDEN